MVGRSAVSGFVTGYIAMVDVDILYCCSCFTDDRILGVVPVAVFWRVGGAWSFWALPGVWRHL